MRFLVLLATALACGSTPRATAQVALQPPKSFPLSAQPIACAAADVDLDGDLDLLITTDEPALEVLAGDGAGGFTPFAKVHLPAGSSPAGLAACDLDGDGDIDIAVALTALDVVQSLVRVGGSWFAGPSYPVGARPVELASGDLDLDGDWDLVLTATGLDEVWVLRNQGTFAFTATGYPAGADLRGLVVAELSGDALPDVAVSAFGDRVVRLLHGAGGAALVPGPVLISGLLRPIGLAAADLDGNRHVDLAACGNNGGTEFAIVHLNQGGSWAPFKIYDAKGSGLESIALGDLTVDGFAELAIANPLNGSLTTLHNDGTGKFGVFPEQWSVGVEPVRVASYDLDGSGSSDLVVLDGTIPVVSVLLDIPWGTPGGTAVYCTPKASSLGTLARLTASGLPSWGAGGFSIAVRSGVPFAVALPVWSASGPASAPFLGGTLCVQSPLERLPPRRLAGTGAASFAVPVPDGLIGTTRWYQVWFRDPAQPDGTGAGLSDGLEVTFSP